VTEPKQHGFRAADAGFFFDTITFACCVTLPTIAAIPDRYVVHGDGRLTMAGSLAAAGRCSSIFGEDFRPQSQTDTPVIAGRGHYSILE
jgi:hypothetical protein